MTGHPLIEVEDLRIDLDDRSRHFTAVEGVSFRIDRGETFGLVGESGCGKSITALALIGLLRQPLSIGAGAIRFDGREIQRLAAAEQRALRGNRIAMIFQEPMTALNPVSPVGRQIAEMFVLHRGKSWREANRLAVEALAKYDLVCVHVEAPDEASHEGKAAAKIEALERIDRDIVGPLLAALPAFGEWRLLVAPDHRTPLRTRAHSYGPVPFAVCGTGVAAEGWAAYDEDTAAAGRTFDPGWRLMEWFLKK